MTRILPFRCPASLADALRAAAESRGVPVGEVIRTALGEHLGVDTSPLPVGLGGADAETRQRVAAMGGAAGKKEPPEKKSSRRNTNSSKGLRNPKKKSAKK